MVVLYSYIFNPKTKQVNKKVKSTNNMEKTMTEEVVLLDNTKIDLIATFIVRMAMFQITEENIINMKSTIHEYEEKIKELKEKLAYSKS